GAGLVDKESSAAQAGHAGLKGQAGAQRGLLKKQDQLLARERGAKIRRAVLDDVGQLKQGLDLLGGKILYGNQMASHFGLLQRRVQRSVVVNSCSHHLLLRSAAFAVGAVFCSSTCSKWRMAVSTCCF